MIADLKAIRWRVEFARKTGTCSPIVCMEDRENLLALVERMRPYVGHRRDCDYARWERGGPTPRCTCGLDDLRRVLGDGA